MTEPEVRVAAGTLRGRLESGLAVFTGIPFAEPPERFAAPQPVEAWDGTRDALAYGPPPPQSGLFGTDALAGSADGWLTVNVWTPDPAANLPVLVWIQGGGYLFGTSGLPEYDGGRLARDGGVVVVTFNYRVGIEGFAQIDGAPANRGLLDQVAALEWVRDNIGAFGGDPDRVTVFGQSAGGGSVAALLAMPRGGRPVPPRHRAEHAGRLLHARAGRRRRRCPPGRAGAVRFRHGAAGRTAGGR